MANRAFPLGALAQENLNHTQRLLMGIAPYGNVSIRCFYGCSNEVLRRFLRFFVPLPEIWDIESPRISAVILQKKMAAVGSKGKRSIVNYKDLNAISFVVLYDAARKSMGNFFEVDRLIEKRQVGHVSCYIT